MMNKIGYVLVADRGVAYLYDASELKLHDLKLIKEFQHPDGRKKTSELVTDHPGYNSSGNGSANAYESKHAPQEVETDHFAKHLAAELASAFHLKEGESFVVVALAHFYNMFKTHYKHHAEPIHINKDLVKFGIRDLTTAVRGYLQK